jgi:hypothetical protein
MPRLYHERDTVIECSPSTGHVGRYLLVVLARSGDGRWYVLTARSMTDSERRIFKKKAK